MGDRERAVAADRDHAVEPEPAIDLQDPIGVAARAVRGLYFRGDRIAGAERAQDGAAHAQDPGDVPGGQHPRTVHLEQAVEAVFDAERLDAVVGRGLDDRSDDGVEPGCVPAAGEDADARDRRHVDRV